MAVYNLTVVGSCLVAAIGAFALTQAFGGNGLGAILAGLAYAFYPNRQVYLSGFLNPLLASTWLPWLLLGLVQAGRFPQQRGRWLTLAGLAFAMSVAGAWQYVFLDATIVVIFGYFYLWPLIRQQWRAWLRPGLAAGLIAALIIGPWLLNAYLIQQEIGQGAEFSFDDLRANSVSLERLLVPSALNPLVWDLARTTFPLINGEDGVVSLGYVPLLLALFGLARSRPWPRPLRALLVLAVVGLFLMPGPFLHVRGQPITIRLPGQMGLSKIIPPVVTQEGRSMIPMPALLLYGLLPPFRSFHHFGRWGVIPALAIATLAGLGFTRLTGRHHQRNQMALGGVCLLLLLLEFNTQPLPSVVAVRRMERSVDRWLASTPEQNVIIEYPLSYTLKAQSLYYTTIHHQRIVHGYTSILPPAFAQMLPALNE